MTKLIVNLGEQEDQLLNFLKGKFKLKNKSDAVNFIITQFADYHGTSTELAPSLRYLQEKDDPWMLAEDIPDMDFFFSKIWLNCFVKEFEQFTGKPYKKILVLFKGYHLWFYFGEKDSFDVGENIAQKFVVDPSFADKVNKNIIIQADKLRKLAASLPETGLQQLSNIELNHFYNEHEAAHAEYYLWAWIPPAVDMFHNNLTNLLKKYLADYGVQEEKINEYFIILTQPSYKSLIQQEQEEFLRLAADIQKDKKQSEIFSTLYKAFVEQDASLYGFETHTPEYEAALERRILEIKSKINPLFLKRITGHYQQYFYVKFMWIGKEGLHSFDHYIKELVKFIGRKSDAVSLLHDMNKEFEKNKGQKENLLQKLNVNTEHITLFNAFGDFMVTKIYRRFAQIFAVYRMQPILKEIARRCQLSLMQVRFMTTPEIEAALLRKELNSQELNRRVKLCVYYADAYGHKIMTGIEATRIAEMLEKRSTADVSEFKGQTGCIGKAKGIVKIIIRPEDMSKMNEGDILVSIATDPDIVPAMKKAAAFVTEQGGVTSHAAIVAREMNKPCVIGTKIATRVLKDGDMVEVDATKGIVKILSRNN